MHSYAEANAYIDSLQMFGIKLGLDNIRTLAAGLDGAAKRPGFLHLAGSNGKGSTGAMLQAMLRRAGFKVGFFSSPHLVSVRERIRIDGRALSEDAWLAAADRVRRAARALEETGAVPTYFEFHTAMALAAFADSGVDFAVWETGMGGRLDATNVIETPTATAITGIALEHQKYLGDTLARIAGEKAGIIKPGAPVYAGLMPAEALAVIEARAAACGVPFHAVGVAEIPAAAGLLPDGAGQLLRWEGRCFPLALTGTMQRRNAALALRMTKDLSERFGFDFDTALEGLADVKWPARMQELPGGGWVDGGHNPDGIRSLIEALRERFGGARCHFIFGAFADKEVDAELAELAELAESIIFVPVHGGEAKRDWVAPEELLKRWRARSAAPASTAPDVESAWRRCPGPRRVVCGSLYIAGELLKALFGAEAALNL